MHPSCAVAPTPTQIESPWLRRAAKLAAAYRKALQPRLLVPIGLGCLIGVYNRVTGDTAPVLYSGCLLLGFLSYKLALITKLVSDLAPKVGVGGCCVRGVLRSSKIVVCTLRCVWDCRPLEVCLCAFSRQHFRLNVPHLSPLPTCLYNTPPVFKHNHPQRAVLHGC